jgi:transposase
MLGISERTFRRWRDRLRDEGLEGLRDRRIGKPSSRRAAVEEIQRMLGLYQERYAGFTMKHFHEQLQKRHNYKLFPRCARPRSRFQRGLRERLSSRLDCAASNIASI